MSDQRTTEWRRDGSGNLWRVWRGRMLFLFLDRERRWRWSVADGRRTRLSDESFPTQGEAEAALRGALAGGPEDEPSGAEGRSGELSPR